MPPEVLGHAREGDRGDGVGLDVVLGALDGEHPREADETHLGGAVVGLAEVAEDARRRRRRDDPAVALLAHVDPRRLGDVERAAEVDVEDGVDEVGGEVLERLVAEDAGVVDDDVDAPEGVDCGLHDRRSALGRGDRVGVGDRFAAGGLDLVDHLLRRPGVGAGAVDRAAEVVDHDQRTAGREQQRVLTAEATTRPRDDRHLAVESELTHGQAR